MGVSTDGILCYGCLLVEDSEYPWRQFEDGFDSWLAAVEGNVNAPLSAWSEETKAEYHAYWKARDDFLASYPVSLVRHCSGECPMWILAVRATVMSASRGYPKKLDFMGLQSAAVMHDSALVSFIGKHQLGVESLEPRWLLASLWW